MLNLPSTNLGIMQSPLGDRRSRRSKSDSASSRPPDNGRHIKSCLALCLLVAGCSQTNRHSHLATPCGSVLPVRIWTLFGHYRIVYASHRYLLHRISYLQLGGLVMTAVSTCISWNSSILIRSPPPRESGTKASICCCAPMNRAELSCNPT